MNAAIEEAVDCKILWRKLIDNACSMQGNRPRLSDNELIAFLMTLQGFATTEIAPVLESTSQEGYLSQSRAQQLLQRAFQKTLTASGITRRVDMVPVRSGRRSRR